MQAQGVDQIKKLPEQDKAQIAKILLSNERKELQIDSMKFPILKLLKNSEASNLAVEFLRVSSEGQREGYSLDAQKEKAAEYTKQHNLNSVRVWSVAESASKELDRKEFFEMLNYVSENGIKNVVFDKIDRACRGLRGAVLIEDLIEAGVSFHFTRDNLIVDKHAPPGDKLRFYLGVVLAKYYIDNLKTEIKKGIDRRWDEGYLNSLAPFGYKNMRDDAGRAWAEINPDLAPHVREVFELYATGNYSYQALASHLQKNKIFVTKKVKEYVDGKVLRTKKEFPVSHKAVEKFLCNPFYYGARRRFGKTIVSGTEKHTPLISKELFNACQKIKSLRAKNSKISHAHEIAKPFMNLMKCGACNHMVTGEVHKKSSGKTYIYYHCANQSCPQRRINVRQEVILADLRKAFDPFAALTPKATAAFIENIKDQLQNLNLYSSEKLEQLGKVKASIEKRCNDLATMFNAGALDESEYKEIVSQKGILLRENELEIESHIKIGQKTFIAGLEIIELIGKSFEFMRLEGNELDKARLAKLVLSNTVLLDGSLRYDYKKPFDDLVLLTGHRKWWLRRESNSHVLADTGF